MRRLTAALVRLSALVVLVAVLVAVPAGAVAVLGRQPDGSGSWDALVRGGRIDDATVIRIGVILFVALWAWFAITALAEVGRVLTARRHLGALKPLTSTPTGWVRHLVRVALVSSSAVVGSSMALLSVAAPLRTSIAAAAPAHETAPHTPPPAARVGAPATVRSSGRDTPYSVAVTLGDAALRDRIIELNRGSRTPDGGSWTGGVFPAGMDVRVPAGLLQRDEVTWQTYTVDDGDSVFRIATRLSAGDHRRVRPLADQIIERNLGHTMNDGRVFEDPSLIRVGWQLEVPVPAVSGAAHTVTAGESYWSIADEALPDDATPADVADLTHQLIVVNAPQLGHDDPVLLLVGDTVHVPESAPAPVELPEVMPVTDEHDAIAPVEIDTAPEPVTAPVEVATTIAPTTVPATTTPAPATTTPVVDAGPASETTAPVSSRLGAALLLCAGALGLVETRRRHQLRRAGSDVTTVAPVPADVLTERTLRSLDPVRRAARLELSLRSAGHLLAGSGGWVQGVITTADGGVTVLLDRAGRTAPAPWTTASPGDRWHLPATVTDEELAETARLGGQPCPALVHLGDLVADPHGHTAGHDAEPQVFVDLEAFGLTAIDTTVAGTSGDAAEVITAIAASVALSPVGENVRVIAHGIDPDGHLATIDHARVDHTDDLDDALDLAAATLGTTPTAIGGRRTFELRSRGVGGETWEPVVVAVHGDRLDVEATREIASLTLGGGRGLAVVTDRPIDGAGLVLRARPDGWLVDPLDLVVVPVGLTATHLDGLAQLVAASDDVLQDDPPAPAPSVRTVREPAQLEPDWPLMVRVLGRVRVTDRAGNEVGFERAKALELVAWLSQHRERPTRSMARATLWETAVRDATFANVVSEARRGLGRAVTPPEGEEWIGRTLTEHLPLHASVVTDAELLRRRREVARHLPSAEAIDVLAPGVALIAGAPFGGTDYLWPDAEGITSSLVLLATGAAADLATHHLALGDIDGVFRATGVGLEVLPGHEELIGLRMRAHARRGDLSGVRHEWEAYERALLADAWSSCDPSPKLVSLRRQLLTN